MIRSQMTWMTSPSRCTRPFIPIIAAADMTVRRCASNRSGQRMPLAMPVSSSMVMNSTPLALPGFWRTRMIPATSTWRPSLMWARSAQRTMPRRVSPAAGRLGDGRAATIAARGNPPPPRGPRSAGGATRLAPAPPG